jgi:prepilin-type N-terminal cleavage/methylation domain-containing protein
MSPPVAKSQSISRTSPQHRAFSLIEVLVVLAIIGVLIAFFLPATQRARPAAQRTQCRNNLKQIGLALHNYHDQYGAFPPVYTVDSEGQPLHSWRTLLLPYLDQAVLYERLDLSKPWNDPVNAEAFKTTVPVYQCPSSREPRPKTTYLAIRTDNSVWQTSGEVTLKDITDGTSNTLFVVEVPEEYAVPWMEPRDGNIATVFAFLNADKLVHTGGVHVLIADGAVRFLSANMQADTLRALLTKDGGETVSNDW